MTSLTLLTIVIIVVGATTSLGYGRALALGGATPVGAALVFGTVAVPTFYAVAFGALIGVIVRELRRARLDNRTPRAPLPGGATLIGFAVWSISLTLVASLLFAGVIVYYPSTSPGPLPYAQISVSNLAQILYLLLGISVVFLLARGRPDPSLIGLVTTVITVLSFWRYLSLHTPLPFPDGIFDNSPAFTIIELAPGGIPRFRGILSEPAGLATICLVTIAYMASRAAQVRGWHRVGVLVVLGLAAFMASISTSATFVVALVIVTGLALVVFLYRAVVARRPISPAVAGVVLALAISAFWVIPVLYQVVNGVVSEKVGSSSYDARGNVDGVSYQILGQTYGIGVGLGSHRPSSFVAALLSTTGIPGTLLFALTIWFVVRAAIPVVAYRPVIWGLLALLTTKVIAAPDLADSSGILWISIGLLAQAGLISRRSQAIAPPLELEPQEGRRGRVRGARSARV